MGATVEGIAGQTERSDDSGELEGRHRRRARPEIGCELPARQFPTGWISESACIGPVDRVTVLSWNGTERSYHGDAMTPSSEDELLDLGRCAQLLGVSRWWLWLRARTGLFVAPHSTKNGTSYWTKKNVYSWAADPAIGLSSRVPIRFWPPAQNPATYLGARQLLIFNLWGRMEAAGRFAGGEPLVRIAEELRVDVRSVQRWHRVWGPVEITALPRLTDP